MFSNFIKTTQIDNARIDIVEDVRRSYYDSSLSSTMKALLFKRVEANLSPIFLYCVEHSVSEDDVRDYPRDTVIYRLLNGVPINNINNKNLFFLSAPQQADDGFIVEYMKNNFTEVYPDFIRVKKITEFFKKSFKVVCFIRPAYRQVVLFLDSPRLEIFHAVQAAIPVMMPWFFADNDLSNEELELLFSLEGDDASKYCECINNIANVKGVREENIQSLLKGAELYTEKNRAEYLRREIDDFVSRIASLSRDIASFNESRERATNELFTLDEKLNNGDSESSGLAEYFCCNKNLQLIDANLPYITFVVTGYLEYFDKDLATRVINNPNSIAYKYNGCSYADKDETKKVKALLTEIFINETAKIRVCAAYDISLDGRYDSLSGYEFSDDTLCSNAPNPHIQHYRCMGSYSTIVGELLQIKDYIGAIEQCAASCRSLNFGDSTVMSVFMREFFYGTRDGAFDRGSKCVELQDGTKITPSEALEWAWSRANTEVNSNE